MKEGRAIFTQTQSQSEFSQTQQSDSDYKTYPPERFRNFRVPNCVSAKEHIDLLKFEHSFLSF